jgi:hypothetical protein
MARPHVTHPLFYYLFIYLSIYLFMFIPQFCEVVGLAIIPQVEWAKFGYKSDRKVENFLRSCPVLPRSSLCKIGNF